MLLTNLLSSKIKMMMCTTTKIWDSCL